MGSGTGIGRSFQNNPFETIATGILTGGAGLLVAGQRAKQQQRKGKETKAAAAANDAALAAQKAAREKAISDASIAAQKEKARKQTIFAGAGQQNIFSPTLGGTSGNKTLG